MSIGEGWLPRLGMTKSQAPMIKQARILNAPMTETAHQHHVEHWSLVLRICLIIGHWCLVIGSSGTAMRTAATRFWRGILASALVLPLAACSSEPSGRFDVSGTVTFKDRPVPAGLIAINPDLSKGNDGPQGLAEIKDGRFDTRNLDKGAPSGAVILMIDGFDGVPQPESPYGKPLFFGYKLSLELPKEATEQSIQVPESAGASVKNRAASPLP
jgi:hypothetical protein